MNGLGKIALFLLFGVTFFGISLILPSHPAIAETDPPGNEAVDSGHSTPSFWKVPPGLSEHKPTYFLFTWSSSDAGRRKEELKFQISFKQRLFSWGKQSDVNKKYKLYFGYTQKSFWQVFDTSHSSPFRETNYNPEFFIKTPEYKIKWGMWSIDGGYEHESNGQDIPASRSWDRLYIRPRLEKDIFTIDYKLWYRCDEKKKVDQLDTEGDDNPDIEEYYGNGELNVRIDFGKKKGRPDQTGDTLLHFDKSVITVMARYAVDQKRGAIQADYFLPLANKIKLYFQYWEGYGESLIDYNKRFAKYGIGLALID